LAWVASTGAPHVAPVWFVLDGDDVVFNTHRDTGKAKAVAREGRASLLADMEEPPFAFVKIDGTVTFEDDLERVRALATEIGARYMGADRAEEFGKRNSMSGEVVVRLTPTKITALDDVAGYGD
jgi:PPOX class probable F420-dependent enzyme